MNELINDFSKNERNGFVIVMGLLADRYPLHDTWEGLLAGGLKAIIFGTHSKSSGKQNRPSFAIYKKSGASSAPVFGLRFDDNALRAEVAEKLGPDAYGIRFPLGDISESLSVLTSQLDLWAKIEGISNRMTGSSAVVLSDDGLAPEKKVWLEDELAWVKRRRGQAEFRERLMNIYGRTCALTGCAVEPVLQACHIAPHSKGLDYASSNGLLMRSDLHLLFDAGLLKIDGDGIVYVQPSLKSDPSYQNLDSQSIQMPVLDKAGLELFKRGLAARFSEISG
ncbi:HNH endonuclease [Pseudomonas sp. p50]|uniref:HNH endonuclease n=1 Tax=Pseudomonas sp. p50(2008) TaxID=2816832 RepID=UPI00188CEAB2|nr:HNH endonuclease signature motif containing protein [Pseudomonas sp. p50(2008)]MBF4559235.1 HNH endonuclease [Pseudomonas sp. p50(2008)]